MRFQRKLALILLNSVLLISGCVTHQPPRLTHPAFTETLIHTTPFVFTAYEKFTAPNEPLTIYIEGDGHARLSRSQISPNPTPHNPLALKLAFKDPSQNVAYLARPFP